MRTPSYSSINTHHTCPRKYKYRYVDEIKYIYTPAADAPDLIGKVFHLGMEKDIAHAEKYYFDMFPVVSDQQITEWMKINRYLERGHKYLRHLDVKHREFDIDIDDFRGIIDLVTDNHDGTVDIWDYKYCSEKSVDAYAKNEQLHLYKYFYEKVTGERVGNIRLLIFPKVFSKQRSDESVIQFRNRVMSELDDKKILKVSICYSEMMLKSFAMKVETRNNDKLLNSAKGDHCEWCEYKKK